MDQFLLTITISGGSSMYLRLSFTTKPTPYHALKCSVHQMLYPSQLLIIQSLKLSPVLLIVLHNRVLPLLLGIQGSKDFPASRCVASSYSLMITYHVIIKNITIPTSTIVSVLPDLTMQRMHCQGLKLITIWLIPVVTFLTPLA